MNDRTNENLPERELPGELSGDPNGDPNNAIGLPPEEEWGAALRATETVPDGVPPPRDAFRTALLERTRHEVAARAGRSGGGAAPLSTPWMRAAAAALIFAAGWWAGRGQGNAEVSPPPARPEVSESVGAPELPSDPRVLEESLGAAPRERRRDELARAGDAYLSSTRTDVGAAIYCYRRALDEPEPADLEASPEDSWLLKALKVARR